MRTAIVTSELSPALLGEWQDLHARVGRFPFTNPRIFQAWWRSLGSTAGHVLHVATVHDDNRLVAVAPLTVSRYKVLNVLQWAGGNDLGYCDALCESAEAQTALWQAIRLSGRYDIGLIKTLHGDSETCAFVGRFARQVRNGVNYVIDVKWPSGRAWMKEAVSSHARKNFRNMENQLKAKGELKLKIFRHGEIPGHVLSVMVDQKAMWARQANKSCMFDRPREALAMLTEISRRTVDEGILVIAWLQLDNSVIATLYAMIQNKIMYFMITSYDRTWHKNSPGRLLLYKVFAWAMDSGVTRIDLMQGENEYKKGVAELSTISLNDFTFPVSVLGRVAEPILARTYFKERAPVD